MALVFEYDETNEDKVIDEFNAIDKTVMAVNECEKELEEGLGTEDDKREMRGKIWGLRLALQYQQDQENFLFNVEGNEGPF